ncbi:MAG: S1 RNA-binding domain-containing protein [Lachnospiraceae bacterium]|nr:S1 RNA-binding domain-containing protein [Lachnospiraceae bacterium]
MIELGKRQELTIVKRVDFGVYLADVSESAEEKVLLPAKQVPAGAEVNDKLTVFVYRDSKDRLIATTKEPMLQVGEFALLTVKQVGKFGAFLDWGLEKDLLLPFKEQTTPLKAGDECVAALYIDKSNRLCATMKIYHYLRTDSPYRKDDKVEGIVYEISDNFGVFVAVDNCYSGLIPKKEPAKGIAVGDRICARVTEVKEDGKLSLSIREKAYMQIDTDAKKLMEMLKERGGKLPFSDKADPELIRGETGMSKNEFKKAVGNLYKQRLILIEKDRITLVKEDV